MPRSLFFISAHGGLFRSAVYFILPFCRFAVLFLVTFCRLADFRLSVFAFLPSALLAVLRSLPSCTFCRPALFAVPRSLPYVLFTVLRSLLSCDFTIIRFCLFAAYSANYRFLKILMQYAYSKIFSTLTPQRLA